MNPEISILSINLNANSEGQTKGKKAKGKIKGRKEERKGNTTKLKYGRHIPAKKARQLNPKPTFLSNMVVIGCL